jgi:hypothetical protein
MGNCNVCKKKQKEFELDTTKYNQLSKKKTNITI